MNHVFLKYCIKDKLKLEIRLLICVWEVFGNLIYILLLHITFLHPNYNIACNVAGNFIANTEERNSITVDYFVKFSERKYAHKFVKWIRANKDQETLKCQFLQINIWEIVFVIGYVLHVYTTWEYHHSEFNFPHTTHAKLCLSLHFIINTRIIPIWLGA